MLGLGLSFSHSLVSHFLASPKVMFHLFLVSVTFKIHPDSLKNIFLQKKKHGEQLAHMVKINDYM